MISEKSRLTGRHRYRSQNRLFRSPVLVLQVELRGLVSFMVGNGPIESEWRTWWRDATIEDICGWSYAPAKLSTDEVPA